MNRGLRLLTPLLLVGGVASQCSAQSISENVASSSCSLKDHVYKCDGAAFQKLLAASKTVTIETHSVDKLAQAQLKDLLTKKLGKTLAAESAPADLIFLLIPVGVDGVNMITSDQELGTMRVYSANADGGRASLLWAEDYFGQSLPWPAVVHGLILQFQTHFKIK